MDDNIYAFEAVQYFADDLRCALRCGHVRLDIVGRGFFRRGGPGRNGDGRAALQEPFGDRLAGALGSSGYQDAFPGEFTRIDRNHEWLLLFFLVLCNAQWSGVRNDAQASSVDLNRRTVAPSLFGKPRRPLSVA